ncbi:MAG: glycosyltransferase [Smithellaceae bacterium]
MKKYLYGVFAAEISSFSRFYDRIIECNRLPHDQGRLFDAIDCPEKIVCPQAEDLPDLSPETTKRTLILLNGTLNHSHDIQGIFKIIKQKISRNTRIVIVLYNPYLRWLYLLANLLGIRKGDAPSTFLTRTDINNLCRISGFEIVRSRMAGFFPFQWLFIGSILNRVLPVIPFLKHFGLTNILILRPVVPEAAKPSLSVIIPARNEAKNIENALIRMPALPGTDLEIIFVEGHSTDETWEEIQSVQKKYAARYRIKALRQNREGKNDAVKLGLSHAEGDLYVILDADLTMPPEQMQQFYEIYCDGIADFVNGSRLVYPMEKEAMRFLNRLGNVFFAKMLSHILDARLSDSLCGTKLFSRHDYRLIQLWQKDFGKFDPFGDFELLFPAAVLSIGIIDVPIRYRSRTYGSTNISRFRHGLMLFKMVSIGFFRIKLGKTPK